MDIYTIAQESAQHFLTVRGLDRLYNAEADKDTAVPSKWRITNAKSMDYKKYVALAPISNALMHHIGQVQ